MSRSEKRKETGTSSLLQGILIFAIPLLISNLFQQLYNAADTMIVGNYLGEQSLAAVGACIAVYELLVGFGIGIGNGLSIVTARAYGSGDRELLKKSVAGSLVIGVVVTGVIMAVSACCLKSLLTLLGTPADILEEAYSYLSLITMFAGVMFAYNLFSGLLRAIGNSVMPLVFLVISSVLNIGLDILMITWFQMGVRGTAVATIIAQGISVLLCIVYIIKKSPMLVPSKEHFKVGRKLYAELWGQGLSMGLMLGIVSAGTVILQSGINRFGTLTIAAHTSARKLQTLCNIPIASTALAASTFASQNRGAGQKERIRKGMRTIYGLTISWSIVMIMIMFLFSGKLVSVLSGSSHPEVIGNGSLYLKLNSLFYPVLSVLLSTRYALQGLGSKLIPLISSIIELIGKILFVIFLIPKMGYLGVILCEPIIWIFMTTQLVWSYLHHPYMQRNKKE